LNPCFSNTWKYVVSKFSGRIGKHSSAGTISIPSKPTHCCGTGVRRSASCLRSRRISSRGQIPAARSLGFTDRTATKRRCAERHRPKPVAVHNNAQARILRIPAREAAGVREPCLNAMRARTFQRSRRAQSCSAGQERCDETPGHSFSSGGVGRL
jgi:hypothetical protein